MSAKRQRPPLDMSNLPHALRPDDAAKVISLTPNAWYRYVRPHVLSGEILSYRVGKSVRIITSSLLAWQERQARNGAA